MVLGDKSLNLVVVIAEAMIMMQYYYAEMIMILSALAVEFVVWTTK